MSRPRWQTVLFDLDGTLANTIPLIVASYVHAAREVLGRELTPQESRGWIGRPLINAAQDLDPARADELVRVYTDWNLAHLDHLAEPYPGISELLDDLRACGVGLGVATSKRHHSAELTLASVGLAGRIELLATLTSTPRHKPHPEPLLLACELLDGRVESCVYVGDATVDIQAARAAGMSSIAVTWGAGELTDLRAEEPTHLVTTVPELRALLLP